jgi:CspA family cold shock protein
MNGIVKWYNPRKGYGFISGEDGNDAFIHRDNLGDIEFLNEGDTITYEVIETEKGLKATNIKLVS